MTAIITTYRRPDVLPRAIRSVLDQTLTEIEVLVVDDEPSQEVRAIVASTGDPRLRYLANEQGQGPSAARNIGIRASTAACVAFLDDDDEWTPDKLAKQLAALDTAGGCAVVTSLERWQRPDGASVRDIRLDGAVLPTLLRHDVVHMQTLLVPTSAFEAVGYFDETLLYNEDLDMALRLASRYPFVTVPEALTVIHVTPGSLSTNSHNRIDALERIIAKTPEIQSRRRVRSRWLAKLARVHGEAGDRAAWRQGLLAAVRTDPLNLQAAAVLVVGLVGGPQIHSQLARERGRVARGVRAARGRLSRFRTP